MNSKNYTYIRILLNGSCVTDEILNRIFCLNNPEVTETKPQGSSRTPVREWCFLGDEKAQEIKDWIKKTDARVRSEKLKARFRARFKKEYYSGDNIKGYYGGPNNRKNRENNDGSR